MRAAYKSNKLYRNRYFVLRHGQSEANVLHLITSDPVECISNYGLTKQGKEQVTASVLKAKLRNELDGQTIIVSSDYKRTLETARLAQTILGISKIHTNPALRERFFGELDGTQADTYIDIWPKTQADAEAQKQHKVEDAKSILARLIKLVDDLEAQYDDSTILLVTHGDPAQVLQVTLGSMSAEQRKALMYIEPAEIRRL